MHQTPTENVPTNSLVTQWGDKEEKQVTVNNYYIRNKTEGWKQLKQGEILPNTPKSHMQTKSSEISPNETRLQITTNQGLKTLEEPFTHIGEDTRVTPRRGPDKRTVKEQQRFHAEGPEVQNLAPPPTEHYNHPPPTWSEGKTVDLQR